MRVVGITAPSAMVRASIVSNARVDHRVEDVDDEIEEENEDGDDHDGAHDERVVAVQGAPRRSSARRPEG